MSEQSVRVTAKADFEQLKRGLKQLQGDLRDVTGEIDRGARKGGFFDDSQIRALDFFGKRFKNTLQEMKDAFEEHGHAYQRLLSQARQAQGAEKEAFEKEIKHREEVLNKMEEQLSAAERLYSQRQREAEQLRNMPKPDKDNSGGAGGSSSARRDGASGLFRGLSGVAGIGKLALGMAGVGGVISMIQHAYEAAKAREINSLDLAQRMRGQNGWEGSNVAQWDRASEIGRRDRMGYQAQEVWGFLDQYTRQAGTIGESDTMGLLKFGRAYGLDTSEVAGMAGQNRSIGGVGRPKDFADAIAGSVGASGMTPRILEVMQTNNALLERMNTTLKDGSTKQILAYQTTLDRIGLSQGMMQLTGAQGANLIGGLGGIFQPGEENWKWMGIRALQQYDPEKYGSMGLFDLESSFEDGLMNSDNIPAMAQYVKAQAGGNKSLEKRIMQKWLTDGGFAATKTEASEFYEATNGLTVFNEDAMAKLQGGAIDSGAKYDAEREDLKGQGYMDTDARFERAMEQIGQPIVTGIYALKEGVTTVMEDVLDAIKEGEWGQKIYEFISENWKLLATVAGVGIVASNVLKVISAISLLKGFGGGVGKGGLMPMLTRFGIPAALVAGGTWAAVEGFQAADEWIKDGGFRSEDVAKQNFKAMHGIDAPDWVTHPDQLDMNNTKKYFRNDPRWLDTEEGKKETERLRMSPDERKRAALEDAGFKLDKNGNFIDPKIDPTKAKEATGLTDEQIDGLAEYLSGLKDAGESDIGEMKDESIKKFNTMQLNTGFALDTVQTLHMQRMDAILKEHSGFKTMMYMMFQPVSDYLNALVSSGMHFGSMSNAFGSSYDGSGVGSIGGSIFGSPTDTFFKGWQSRVTSRFGNHESFRQHQHRGLDIDGNQGDVLDALAGGIVDFIKMDDGGELDKDGKMNTTAGGTEVGVRMPDGRTYFYSHLSKVNPDLQVGAKVNAGDYIGNMGGDKGAAGSGYSTTGSHLHLGYKDENGVLLNPEELLAGLNAGDSDIGTVKSASASKTSEVKVKSEITVKLELGGDGAEKLNSATTRQLESLVRRIVAENERLKMSMNPTKMGWGT